MKEGDEVVAILKCPHCHKDVCLVMEKSNKGA